MRAYCIFRCLSLLGGSTFGIVVLAVAGGRFVRNWQVQAQSPVTLLILATVVLIVVLNELLKVHRFQRALDHITPEHEPATKLLIHVPARRRIWDLVSYGAVAVLISALPLYPGSSRGLESWHSICLGIAWVCHALNSVTNVDNDDNVIVFHTALGSVPIPRSLFINLTESSGSGYFLRFRFRIGSFYVLNPVYPSRKSSLVAQTLDSLEHDHGTGQG